MSPGAVLAGAFCIRINCIVLDYINTTHTNQTMSNENLNTDSVQAAVASATAEALQRMYAVAHVYGCPQGADIAGWLTVMLGHCEVRRQELARLSEYISRNSSLDGSLPERAATYVHRVVRRLGEAGAADDTLPSSSEPA